MTDFPRELTFIISGASGLDRNPLRQLLLENGFVEKSIDQTDYVGFFQFEQYRAQFDKRGYFIRSYLKNILSNEKKIITNKESLSNILKQHYPTLAAKYLPETFNLYSVYNISPGQIYIARPVGDSACAGKDIFIITNTQELNEVKRRHRRYSSSILSQYITNPLLWEGRKFHLRMYLLIRAGPDLTYETSLWKRGKILTAAEPYKNEDFGNKRIHDTHVSTTPRNLYFPEDLPLVADTLFQQMNEITFAVTEIMRDHSRPYPESKNAYEVFGLDFLVTDRLEVKLLEINDRVGYDPCNVGALWDPAVGPWTPDFTQFSKEYFTWIYFHAIRPTFFPFRLLDRLVWNVNQQDFSVIDEGIETQDISLVMKYLNEPLQWIADNQGYIILYYQRNIPLKYNSRLITNNATLFGAVKTFYQQNPSLTGQFMGIDLISNIPGQYYVLLRRIE